jgi:CRISPR-associated protein (TIGR03986 family)
MSQFKKPYGFVSLPQELTSSSPIWHDGTSSAGRLSGEIRFELETLTPLLVGWERQTLNETEEPWAIPFRKVSRSECAEFVKEAALSTYPDANDSDEQQRQKKQRKVEGDRRKYIERVQDHIVDVQVQNAGWSNDSKSVLCPLRAPWGKRPVVIPGDSLKGLLRHELGALLAAPMERVAERSYSYRPNSLFPNQPNPKLVARIARVPNDGVEMKAIDDQTQVRVPMKLELLPTNLRYDRNHNQTANYYRFDDGNGATYRGGQGAGQKLNSKRNLHTRLTANPSQPIETAALSQAVQDGYLATVRHLIDLDHGHFSERHPDVPNTVTGDVVRNRILKAAKEEVFQPGDLIWVEWDTEKKCIVSLGWHYYYRWAYTDTVRTKGGRLERHGLFPLDEERQQDADGAPQALSPVRRLFGYTGDNEGSAGIGTGDHSQLMGRVFVNAGLEVVGENESDDDRFLKPTFLKELGMPRPSAVEHYLKQPHHPNSRPSDQATLVTYGDAIGYDTPGELAGRKFYLDRKDAYGANGKGLVPGPAADDSPANRQNERSTLALEASKPGRKFRFTIRFRDLDATELAAILVALCPDQFKDILGGTHKDGYCSKLGYARPLGWGSVRIEAKALFLLDESSDSPTLKPQADLSAWVKSNHQKSATQNEWLAIHRRNHPDAADYPRAPDRYGNQNIFTFHTGLRAEHSRKRHYKKG